MRIFSIAGLIVAAVLTLGAAQTLAAGPMASTVHASLPAVMLADVDVDLPKVDVDIDVDKDRPWYKNPLVIGMGVVVVVLIAALAGRGGGGTTIIERRP